MPWLRDTDEVWNRLGRFGVYQFLQMALTTVSVLPMAFHIVSVVFIGFEPEHACSEPPNTTTTNSDGHITESAINVTFDTCQIQWQQWEGGELVTKETGCLFGVNYSKAKTATFVSEWDLVCEKDSVSRLSQSLVLGGMFLGALASPLADRFGRKPVHVIFNIGLLGVTFAMAFVKNLAGFLVLRFFVGTFQQGMLITVVTFWLELLHSTHRQDVGIVNAFMWSSSVNVLALVALLLRHHDWRVLQIALSAFSVFSLLEIFFMDESLRWLFANKKSKEAQVIIDRAQRLNKGKVVMLQDDHLIGTEVSTFANNAGEDKQEAEEFGPGEDDVNNRKLTSLLTDRILRRHSLITWGLWVVNNLTYYGIIMMTPNITGDLYLNFFLGSISEIIGSIVLLIFIKRFTRKKNIIIFQFVGSIVLLLTIVTSQFDNAVLKTLEMIMFAVGRGAIAQSFNAIYLYTPELFPTNLRNAGLGVASAAGRFAGILAPFSVYLMVVAPWLPSLLFGVLCLTFCFLIRYLPETKGRDLPQTTEEIWEWYRTVKVDHQKDTNSL